MKQFIFNKTGKVKNLKLVEASLPEVKEGEVRVKNKYIAINHSDVLYRNGTYPLEKYPSKIGLSGGGIVMEIGSGVESFNIGDQVVYASGFLGSYAEYINIDANFLVKIRDIPLNVAVAGYLTGLTAHYLLQRAYKAKKGDIILIHGITGAVGHILYQWAKSLELNVISTVGSKHKLNEAHNMGYKKVILNNDKDFIAKIMKLTDSKGVNAVYDCYGQKFLEKNCKILTYLGILVNYGDVTGMINKINPVLLWQKSLFFTKTNISVYKANRLELLLSSAELFQKIKDKTIVPKFKTIKFADIPKGHKEIEKRKVIGTIIAEI